jgi:hypothetical protein
MMSEVSLIRLYLMRVLYLLMFIGQGSIQWPQLVHPAHVPTFWHGVGSSMLFGMALVSALGIRYPLQMLPVLLFELTWKLIWSLAIALPQWASGHMDPDVLESAPSILGGVIIVPLVIPWRYFFVNYLKKAGDRWRPAGSQTLSDRA